MYHSFKNSPKSHSNHVLIFKDLHPFPFGEVYWATYGSQNSFNFFFFQVENSFLHFPQFSYLQLKIQESENVYLGDFPGGPVVKMSASRVRGAVSTPGQEPRFHIPRGQKANT